MIQIPDYIAGIIFDCDGTIADTMPMHFRAWTQALGEHNVQLPEAAFYELAGVPTERIIQILNDRHGTHMPIRQTAERKEKLYEELIPHVAAIEPVVEIVRKYHGKLPMAVATGGWRSVVTSTLTSLKLDHYFQTIVTADDVKHGKPSPDIFLEAARRIGVPPVQCVGLEDAELGLQAVRAAGMLAIDVRPAHRAWVGKNSIVD